MDAGDFVVGESGLGKALHTVASAKVQRGHTSLKLLPIGVDCVDFKGVAEEDVIV